jgi:Methyl-accepting chemotaxis protein
MNTEGKTKSKKSIFSIKSKVSLLCTCFIVIAVTVNFIFMFNASKNAITDSTEVTMQSLAASYNDNISETIQQLSRSANFLMSSSSITEFVASKGKMEADTVANLVTMYLSSNTNNEDISIVDADGTVLYSSNSARIGKNLSGETYFTQMVSSGLSTQGDVYTSDTSGDACITFAIPLRTDFQMPVSSGSNTATASNPSGTDTSDTQSKAPSASNGQTDNAIPRDMGDQQTPVTEFTGAIITSVKASAFSGLLSDISIGNYDSGYAFILDASGNVIYHPKENLIGKKLGISEINNILSQVKNGTLTKSTMLTYTYNNIEKYATYSINTNNNWLLFVTADKAEVLDSLNVVAKNTILISAALVLFLSLLAYLFTGTITNSIKKITQLINKTSELDFTDDHSFAMLSSRKDETGEMSRAIERMRTAIKTMIIHISQVSGKITLSSESLSNISVAVNDHASDNSATAQELSASMQETAATTQQIYNNIEQIGHTSADITEKAALGAKLSTELICKASVLKETTQDATVKTRKIYEEAKLRTDAAIEQSKAVEKINILTKTIKDIAGQTSLLALNASIEAARAGEAGSGFSVVASEIGNLANQSAKTVAHITEVVDEVYQAVENMSRNLEMTLDFLETNVLADYTSFLGNSEEYNNDAGIMNETMDNIRRQIDMLNVNVQGISEAISEINMMVNESSKGVNDVAASNTNIVSLTSSTQEKVKENTLYADSLKEIVDKFKLE